MKTYRIGFVVVLIALLLCGCATRPKMAFEDGEQVEPGKAVLLMTFTIKNAYMPSFQPRLYAATIDKSKPREFSDRIAFMIDDKGRNETGTLAEGNSYLLRMPVEPGSYVFQGLVSRVGILCPPACMLFFTPLASPVAPQGAGVFYIGHVSATVRVRQGDEFRAGPVLPLIEQAIVGASGGSFDIEVSDRFATDETLFRSRFPALKNAEITKSVLGPFDRAAAQALYDVPGSQQYFVLQLPGRRRCNSCGAPPPGPK